MWWLWWVVYVVVGLICLSVIYNGVWKWAMENIYNAPPIISGLFPFLGCIFQFGKPPGPAVFLKKCQDKYGSLFTIHVGGRLMTFLTDPQDYATFFTSPENKVDFQFATQPFLTKGFGVSADAYFRDHTTSLECVREKLLPNNLKKYYTKDLADMFVSLFKDKWGSCGEMELQGAVKEIIFWASAKLLFGIDMANTSLGIDKTMLHEFETFDSNFELASSGVPHMFLSKFVNSKQKLLSILRRVATMYDKHEKKEGDRLLVGRELLSAVEDPKGESWLLAVLWAAEANTIPTIFWVLTFLLNDKDNFQQVQAEVDAVFANHPNDIPSYDEFHSMKKLKNCIEEAIRLRSAPIIVRKTVQPVQIGKYTVPSGHFLCLSPLWAHRNDSLYPNPDEFQPSRWDENDTSKPSQHNFGNIAFGAGKYRCPGRFFAYHEMVIFISLVLHNYELELLDKMPEPNWINLVGVQKPAAPCNFKYKKRQHKL